MEWVAGISVCGNRWVATDQTETLTTQHQPRADPGPVMDTRPFRDGGPEQTNT